MKDRDSIFNKHSGCYICVDYHLRLPGSSAVGFKIFEERERERDIHMKLFRSKFKPGQYVIQVRYSCWIERVAQYYYIAEI